MTSQWGGNKSENAARNELRAVPRVFKAMNLTDSVKPLFEKQYFRNKFLQYAIKPFT